MPDVIIERHGYWTYEIDTHGNRTSDFTCSRCGCETIGPYLYCPYCGAKKISWTYHKDYPSDDEMHSGLISKGGYTWRNQSNNTVASFTIEKWPHDWTSISNLWLHPKYRGHGFSHTIVEFAKKQGVNHLSVDPRNTLAINLYKKHGFRPTGETEPDTGFLRMVLIEG